MFPTAGIRTSEHLEQGSRSVFHIEKYKSLEKRITFNMKGLRSEGNKLEHDPWPRTHFCTLIRTPGPSWVVVVTGGFRISWVPSATWACGRTRPPTSLTRLSWWLHLMLCLKSYHANTLPLRSECSVQTPDRLIALQCASQSRVRVPGEGISSNSPKMQSG